MGIPSSTTWEAGCGSCCLVGTGGLGRQSQRAGGVTARRNSGEFKMELTRNID
jgi:hypothetical protein